MTRLPTTVALSLALLILAVPAMAAELIMVEVKGCGYCAKFDREMSGLYQASALGRKVPLKRVDLARWPARMKGVDRPPGAPAFILLEGGRELGRFYSYSGRENFLSSLTRLLKRS